MKSNILKFLLIANVMLMLPFVVLKIYNELNSLEYTLVEEIDFETYQVLDSPNKIVSFSKALRIKNLKDISAVFLLREEIRSNPRGIYERLKILGLTVILIENMRLPDPGEIPYYYSDLQIVKGHLIPSDEFLKNSDNKNILRFRRSVIERGVDIIFLPAGYSYYQSKLKPLLNSHRKKPNIEYRPPFTDQLYSKVLFLLMIVNIIFLLKNLLSFKNTFLIFCFIAMIYLVFSWLDLEFGIINMLSISFILLYFMFVQNYLIDTRTNFLMLTLSSAICGILINCIYSAEGYVFNLLRFRGIKLTLIAPIIISMVTIFFFFFSERKSYRKFIPHLITGILIIVIVMIAKSGNFAVFTSAVEERVRDFLEINLYVRPRFKEFLFGHPIMIYVLYKVKSNKDYSMLYPLAMIGQISVINTFLHFSKPLHTHLLSVFYGVILSIPFVLFLFGLHTLIIRLQKVYE